MGLEKEKKKGEPVRHADHFCDRTTPISAREEQTSRRAGMRVDVISGSYLEAHFFLAKAGELK